LPICVLASLMSDVSVENVFLTSPVRSWVVATWTLVERTFLVARLRLAPMPVTYVYSFWWVTATVTTEVRARLK
jgi:hypothetical protein